MRLALLGFIILMFLGFIVTNAEAQNSQAGWDVVENCIGDLHYPIVPRNKWEFPGVIVSSVHPEGVRGVRADSDVEYFIALESDTTFAAVGALSLDGRYFAYPIGSVKYNVNTVGDDILSVEYVRVVRTDGLTDETYRFEASNFTYTGAGRSLNLESVGWFGNDFIYYPNTAGNMLVDFETKETVEWTKNINFYGMEFVSPDYTRAFTDSLYNLDADEALTYPLPKRAIWLPDSSAFIASNENDTVTLVSRDGETLDTIFSRSLLSGAVSPNQKYFAFWDEELNFFMADLAQHTVYNLCFQDVSSLSGLFGWNVHFPNFAWSPDASMIAFSYDNYLVILDIATFDTKILDHVSKAVIGWASLSSEDVTISDAVLREPVEAMPIPSPTTAIPIISSPTPMPTVTVEQTTATPSVSNCDLEVIAGANLRIGAGADTEKVGSAGVGTQFTAVAQQFNQSEFFRWWRISSGEWIREDFVREGEGCDFLPTVNADS